MEFVHYSVMLNETVDGMNIAPDGVYVDCTFGGGGHSSLILSKLENGKLYGFDRDADAIENAKSDFLQGNVGAGTGMKCHGFKGGIGSSSRIVTVQDEDYILGVLVNSNFGSSNGKDLVINGRKMGPLIKEYDLEEIKTAISGGAILVQNGEIPAFSDNLREFWIRNRI